jgi:hypothetical protein
VRRAVHSIVGLAILLAAAVPCSAGIHYKAVTKTDDPRQKGNTVEVEGWVSGENAKVVFHQAGGNPMTKKGSYMITKNGGKTLYLVDPGEKTYAELDLNAMLGMVGGIMNGMGPLLKIQFTDPKVQKLAEEDGGAVLGLPTKHYKYKTSYSMTVKVLGMGNATDVVQEQDVWATSSLADAGLGVWLRAEPPRTGNTEFDKLISSEMDRYAGFPLKTVTVSTSTQKKGNKQQVTRQTMEVTELDAKASVPDSSFEIPAGYEQTELAMPTAGLPREQ